jgi:Phosphotransferase enzyme family
VQADAIVREIGGVALLGRLTGGEGAGAWAVRMPDGRRAVLKFAEGDHLDFERAARTCDALRARGYPAPEPLMTGAIGATRFGITTLEPGTPLAELGVRHLAPVVDLVDRQRDVGLVGRAPWLDDIVTSVTDGRAGYCEHGAMDAYSPETRTLLDRLRRIAGSIGPLDVPVGDVVHMDFCPGNMLAEGPTITAVFDWEGSTSGDAAFDLVTQSLYAPSLRDALLDSARARTDPRALRLYTAHMVLRQVDWSIRHHDDGAIQWYLAAGTALLAAVEAG